jgi:ABC-type glycerol-3-phosphate transport system permease component
MKQKVYAVILNATLLFFSLMTILPFIWMLLSSFKTNVEISAQAQSFFPQNFTLQNYTDVLERFSFLRYFINSLVYALLITIITIYTSTAAGFVLSKYKFRGRQLLFTCILLTMMVPGVVTIIPRYSIMQSMGWIDSYKALIVPSSFTAFGIFMMRQACFSIPDEMLEAARIGLVVPLPRNK